MAIELVDGSNYDGLFDILGKFVHALNTLNTARGTTVADEALDAINQYKLKTDSTLAFDRAVSAFAAAEQSWRSGGDAFAANIAQTCRQLLAEFVLADDDAVASNLTAQLEYLIDEIESQDYYVDPNTVSGTVAWVNDGSTQRDLGILVGTRDLNGKQLDNALAEVITGIVTQSGDLPTVQFKGERAARNATAEDFPAGSDSSRNVQAVSSANGLLLNADFEGDWSDQGSSKYFPEGWVVTSGTDFSRSTVAVLTATLSGSPTAGEFWLTLHNPLVGAYYGTPAIPYNATAAEVQSAVRAVPGYGAATVARTGTAPNYVYTITCTGLGGNPDAPGAYDSFNSGAAVTGGKTTSGSNLDVDGRTLVIGTAAENRQLEQSVTLTPGVMYVLAVRAKVSSGGGSGTWTIRLLDRQGGSLATDPAGNNITASVSEINMQSAGTRATTWGIVFSVPATYQQPMAVQLRGANGGTSRSLHVGSIILAPATELYAGGPFVGVCSGDNPPTLGQKYTLTMANNRASAWQEAFDRLFDMRSKRLLLPTSGSNLLNDNLIG